MLNILNNHLSIFNDYFVENFHSSLRYQTAESNTDKQIIQKVKIINIKRNHERFKDTFINMRNANILKDKLISLEKKISLFYYLFLIKFIIILEKQKIIIIEYLNFQVLIIEM